MSTVPRMKIMIAAPCALALAIITAACESTAGGNAPLPAIFTPAPGASAIATSSWPTDTQVRAYLKAHPAPAMPGMTAGIRSFRDNTQFKYLRCGTGGHGSSVARGVPGYDCVAWQVTLITATGALRVTCGNITAGIPCPSAAYPDAPLLTGDYVYAPSDGQVTASHDVWIIRRDAIS